MRRVGVVLAGMVLVAGLVNVAPAEGARKKTFTVTKLTDDAPNGCSSSDCSLREAVLAANATKKRIKKVTIRLGAGTHDLTIPSPTELADQSDGAATGDLDLTRPVRIVGVAGATEVVQLADPNRIFHLVGRSSLSLNGVDLRSGDVSVVGYGGAILAQDGRALSIANSVIGQNKSGGVGGAIAVFGGPLSLSNATIIGNESYGGGGGIASLGSVVTISRSEIAGNSVTGLAGQGGGGIYVFGGGLSITDSIILGNSVPLTAPYEGGGILNRSSGTENSPFTMRRSLVSANVAGGRGGGIFLSRSTNSTFGDAPFLIEDSTITDNSTRSEGGGVFCACPIFGDTPYARFEQNTMTGNTADADGTNDEPLGPEGGAFGGSGHQLEFRANIIGDNNDGGDVVDTDCQGNNASLGSNVTTQASCFSPSLPSDNTGVGTLDFLGPLQLNGGPTPTRALLDGSATAVDRHAGAGCAGTDQRGVPRPVGAACDAGAYEYAECGGVIVNIVGTQGSDVLTGTIGPDSILALGGNDRVNAGLGNDKVCGGSGNDVLFGEDDADDLFGEGGDDRLDGGTNLDICVGGSGKDKLVNCEG